MKKKKRDSFRLERKQINPIQIYITKPNLLQSSYKLLTVYPGIFSNISFLHHHITQSSMSDVEVN